MKIGIFGFFYVMIFSYLIVTFVFVSNLLSPAAIKHFPKNCSPGEINKDFNTVNYKDITFCTIMTFDICESYESKWSYDIGTNTYDDQTVGKRTK
jgi:hypothetical protein